MFANGIRLFIQKVSHSKVDKTKEIIFSHVFLEFLAKGQSEQSPYGFRKKSLSNDRVTGKPRAVEVIKCLL